MIDLDTKLRILHIDDNRDFAANFCGIFTQWFRIFSVENCNEALAKLEDNKFDAIIAECNLSRTNGFEFPGILKDRFPHTPLIFYTGECNAQIAREAIKSGASDYFVKDLDNPVHIKKFKNAIRAAIEEKRLEEKRCMN